MKTVVLLAAIALTVVILYAGMVYKVLPTAAPHDARAETWGWNSAAHTKEVYVAGTSRWTPSDLMVAPRSDGDDVLMRKHLAAADAESDSDKFLAFVWDNCGMLILVFGLFTALGVLSTKAETDYTQVRHCEHCGYVGHEKVCPSLACEGAHTVCRGFTTDKPFVGGMFQGSR